MENNQVTQPIIDILSGDSDKDVSRLNSMPTFVNWRRNHQKNIMILSNSLGTLPPQRLIRAFFSLYLLECLSSSNPTCAKICDNIIQISENTNDVQHNEITTIEEALCEFHMTCENLEAYYDLLRELAYEKYYNIRIALELKSAFSSLSNESKTIKVCINGLVFFNKVNIFLDVTNK